jgi:hypothetical protein
LTQEGRAGDDPAVVVSFVLFFLAGVAFGFAAFGMWKWLPLAFPLVLALMTALSEGIDGTLILRLLVALVVTVVGVLLGVLLDRREQGDRARYA